MRKPWTVINCPYDNEMYAVEGEYTVCHNLPIEDARLISAAPDLLEALEAVNQHLCYGISDTIDALKDISSAAIAKAKGEV